MKTRMIVPLILGAAMLSGPVLAAGSTTGPTKTMKHTTAKMTPEQRCTALQSQFDTAIKTHASAPKADQAKSMRAEGGTLCADGKHAKGIAKLHQALKDIGVKSKG